MLRARKYDPLAAIASAKAMEEARKEKAKREAQPEKEDFYPSDDEEETTITSTPAPTVDSSKDFNLMSDRQTSTTSFDDWIKSQQRKKAAAKEQAVATQTIKEEPIRQSKDLKTQVSEETFIKENPELEKVVNDLVEVEPESEPKDDEIVEAAIRKIETEKKRLENGQTQPAPKKSSTEPTKSSAQKPAQMPNSKSQPQKTYSDHHDRAKANKK